MFTSLNDGSYNLLERLVKSFEKIAEAIGTPKEKTTKKTVVRNVHDSGDRQEDKKRAVYLFSKDVWCVGSDETTYGIEVQCSLCKNKFIICGDGGLSVTCPHCRKNITYPPGADW